MNQSEQDNSFIAEALPAFISEAQEQIASIEQLLLQLEDAPDDRELLDALFRCAHTVKGSAGIFGLDAVVAFTHHVETLLDRLREGEIALTPELSTLLLQSNDQIRLLVAQASGDSDDAQGAAARAALVTRLGALAPSRSTAAAGQASASPAAGSRRWHISVRFGADTFRNGMDPLAILSYVGQLGSILAVGCDSAAVPALDALDPEQCHLGFVFELQTDKPREAIEDAFSFVRDDATLHVIGPDATPQRLVQLIDELPDSPRLGEILLSIGAVNYEQLERALHKQREDVSAEGAPRLGELLQADGVHPQIVEAALGKQQKSRESAPGAQDGNRYIRVQADRLDDVINLLGELVIAGAGAALLARQTRNGALMEANSEIGRLIEEIRNGTLQLRMVPIGETFARFRRVVRDTASELGKDVALEIVGGETELDKAVVERIADPLMHLVRNGLDHGLETPEQRLATGKPAQGKLTLSACHESGSVLIRIIDDGRGIQRDKVLQRAWERGLVERGVTPPDTEIFNLIFEAGFSTAEKVTNLSGRGVGMDVVRRNIEALRGTVTIHSVEGQGSTIEIRLPLTLAIIDGFLVGVGASKFIFPLESVVEVIEDRPTATALDARGRSVVELRGRVLPVLSLRTLYALDTPPPERCSVVVIHSGTQRYGVMVDVLLGQHQTVIKPLGRMFRSLRGMSGSSILGNGEVALIFDVASLSQLAAEPAARGQQQPTERLS
ncbi:chemotaxis protein CheA [Rhizobacter sp. AJA081-3]|uniref:chemotaxis protein CheA n=1 Tax=Rhizobacter sp. AJA081-3 TaxID=2753607 RepID=UPI001ADFDA6A|nr:chemotaxis protein CheA [Rhizobacter sp. AJA081-3]QTN23619.1 chemotaxis protein CheA [Rhizobacter sp. AJA081-3]